MNGELQLNRMSVLQLPSRLLLLLPPGHGMLASFISLLAMARHGC
jgi:hypothetical protein